MTEPLNVLLFSTFTGFIPKLLTMFHSIQNTGAYYASPQGSSCPFLPGWRAFFALERPGKKCCFHNMPTMTTGSVGPSMMPPLFSSRPGRPARCRRAAARRGQRHAAGRQQRQPVTPVVGFGVVTSRSRATPSMPQQSGEPLVIGVMMSRRKVGGESETGSESSRAEPVGHADGGLFRSASCGLVVCSPRPWAGRLNLGAGAQICPPPPRPWAGLFAPARKTSLGPSPAPRAHGRDV